MRPWAGHGPRHLSGYPSAQVFTALELAEARHGVSAVRR